MSRQEFQILPDVILLFSHLFLLPSPSVIQGISPWSKLLAWFFFSSLHVMIYYKQFQLKFLHHLCENSGFCTQWRFKIGSKTAEAEITWVNVANSVLAFTQVENYLAGHIIYLKEWRRHRHCLFLTGGTFSKIRCLGVRRVNLTSIELNKWHAMRCMDFFAFAEHFYQEISFYMCMITKSYKSFLFLSFFF